MTALAVVLTLLILATFTGALAATIRHYTSPRYHR